VGLSNQRKLKADRSAERGYRRDWRSVECNYSADGIFWRMAALRQEPSFPSVGSDDASPEPNRRAGVRPRTQSPSLGKTQAGSGPLMISSPDATTFGARVAYHARVLGSRRLSQPGDGFLVYYAATNPVVSWTYYCFCRPQLAAGHFYEMPSGLRLMNSKIHRSVLDVALDERGYYFGGLSPPAAVHPVFAAFNGSPTSIFWTCRHLGHSNVLRSAPPGPCSI
jgi:hypothetical protein